MIKSAALRALFILRQLLFKFKLLHSVNQVALCVQTLLLFLNWFARRGHLQAETGKVAVLTADLKKVFGLADRHFIVKYLGFIFNAFLTLVREHGRADAQLRDLLFEFDARIS